MFSHSGGLGWEPDQGHSLWGANHGFWPKGEVGAWGIEAVEGEGPGFPVLWEGEMGVGPAERNFLEAAQTCADWLM